MLDLICDTNTFSYLQTLELTLDLQTLELLSRKRVACPLQVGGVLLPQVEEFKYLGVLFTSEGRMEGD